MDDKLKRRDFIKKGVGTGVAALMGGGLAWPRSGTGLSRSANSEFPDVAVVQGEDYLASTRKAVDLIGGIGRFIPKNARVAILPNTQSAHPGTFTKPDIVRAVVRMCKTAGAAAVNNRVQVSDAAKQKAAGNLEAGRRRVQVKRGDARSEQK